MEKVNSFNSVKIKNIQWIDGVYKNKKNTKEFLEKYDFHELDIEACLEENQNPRIDHYDDYVFITLHFPKYNKKTRKYYLNEMNFFLSKDKIISLREYEENLISKIFEEYENKKEFGEEFKINSAYILYEVVQVLIEKMFKSLEVFSGNLKLFEENVFNNANDKLVKEMMIKKRNILFLKHMIKPQINVLKMVELRLKKFFDEDLEVYFEDLEDKIQKVYGDIERLSEMIEGIEDSLKTLVSIKTGHTMWVLTLLSTFLLPLTLITSFYGMNIPLPFENSPGLIYGFLAFISILMFGFLYYLRIRV